MECPLFRYVTLAQRRTMALMSRREPLLTDSEIRRCKKSNVEHVHTYRCRTAYRVSASAAIIEGQRQSSGAIVIERPGRAHRTTVAEISLFDRNDRLRCSPGGVRLLRAHHGLTEASVEPQRKIHHSAALA